MPIVTETTVILVNWNAHHLLEDCISSLSNQIYLNFEILIVDNASTDNSLEWISKKYPNIRIIKNRSNLGFSHALNIGIDFAIHEIKASYIATLNPDMVVERGWLSALVSAAASDADVGSVASKIVFLDNKKMINSAGCLPFRDGDGISRGKFEMDAGQYDQMEEIFSPDPGAALYKADFLVDVKLYGEYFDPHYFLYGENIDLAYRGKTRGWHSLYTPLAIAYHHYSALIGADSPKKIYFGERNRIWTLIKNFPLKYILFSPFFTVRRIFFKSSHLKSYSKKTSKRFSLLFAFLMAQCVALLYIFRFVVKRRRIKKLYGIKAEMFKKIEWVC
jgi:GT2 family glycosyltransferase